MATTPFFFPLPFHSKHALSCSLWVQSMVQRNRKPTTAKKKTVPPSAGDSALQKANAVDFEAVADPPKKGPGCPRKKLASVLPSSSETSPPLQSHGPSLNKALETLAAPESGRPLRRVAANLNHLLHQINTNNDLDDDSSEGFFSQFEERGGYGSETTSEVEIRDDSGGLPAATSVNRHEKSAGQGKPAQKPPKHAAIEDDDDSQSESECE